MFLIALLATIIVFLMCLAIYNYANKNTIKVSQRMQRIAQANRRAAVLKHNGGFWDDFTNSPVSTWARLVRTALPASSLGRDGLICMCSRLACPLVVPSILP